MSEVPDRISSAINYFAAAITLSIILALGLVSNPWMLVLILVVTGMYDILVFITVRLIRGHPQ